MLNGIAYSFKSVDFSYGGKAVYSGLDLDIPEGRVSVILGPNGTGKTTLLYLMLGWLKPSAGTVSLHGRSLSAYSQRERGRLAGLLPQKENMAFDYSVMEFILLGRAPHLGPLEKPGAGDRRIGERALCSMDSLALKDRVLTKLSGGETQMVLLARTLTQQPDILLLDEPTNHLDIAHRKKIISIISDYRKSGKTVVFTTHDPELAFMLADYLVMAGVMGQTEAGPVREMFNAEKLSALYGTDLRIYDLEDGTCAVRFSNQKPCKIRRTNPSKNFSAPDPRIS